MKKEKLAEALNEISDRHIAEAARTKKKHRGLRRFAAMAAILAVWIGPFLKIGVHYLILKALGTLCGVFGIKSVTGLIEDFAAAMGLLLGMTGAVCLMLMISTVCFMKGVGG